MIDQFDDEEELNEQKAKKSSEEFEKLLEDSFRKTKKSLSAGDKIKSEILSIGKDEAFVSTGTMHDGLVPRRDLLDADGQLKYKVGDSIELYVTHVKGSEIYLSPKPSAKNVADNLEDAFDMMLPIEGRITEVCKGGVKVSLQGKSAFCPISQIDTKRVETPEDYVGKRFEFLITQFSEGGRNIVVSRRKLLQEQKGLSEGAFVDANRVGSILTGKVIRLEKFGAFVELDAGVEGLVHISELSWSRVNDPADVLQVGQQIQVKVIKVEEKEGRLKIALSLKQAGSEPWENLPPQVKPGQVAVGRVTRCMKFGAFVELVPGVEGLIPLSEMSYTKRVVRSDELVKEGEQVSVMVKEIQPTERRILLSLKDAGSDPWAMVPLKFPVGAIVPGKVERRELYGLFVQLTEGVVGLLPKSKAVESSDFHYDKYKVGDEVVVEVSEVNLDGRRISLGVPNDAGREEWKTYTQQSAGSFGTLGDKLKLALGKKSKGE
jgi:small subunit ribosomal protein S1